MQNLTDYKERTELVKLANHIIDDSGLVWGTKKPITSGNGADIEENKRNLETMTEDLLRLKEINLAFHPQSMGQKIAKEVGRINEQRYKYFETAAVIPQRLLKTLNKINRGNTSFGGLGRFIFRDYEPNETIVFFDYARGVMAMDDGAMSIKKAEMVREGQYTVDELNEHSRQTALSMHGYLNRRERIPDKSPPQIADYVWSALNIMQPIEPIDDLTILYHRIAIGHPLAWGEMDKRRPDGITYINSIEKHHDICFPVLLAKLTSPYIFQLMIENTAKEQVLPNKTPDAAYRV